VDGKDEQLKLNQVFFNYYKITNERQIKNLNTSMDQRLIISLLGHYFFLTTKDKN
jgi:hypothetical protein